MPDKTAYVMAAGGETVTYRQYEDRSNQGAQLFRSLGLRRGDCIAIFMENNARYLEICWAANRAGLLYACISSYLTAEEVAYIIADCGARIVIGSEAKAATAAELPALAPAIEDWLAVGEPPPGYRSYEAARDAMPAVPIADQAPGADMLYSSGTTGRPKGIKTEPSEEPFGAPTQMLVLLAQLFQVSPDTIYLSPAPLYHAAPLRFTLGMLRLGASVVVMEQFDPEQALALIERHRCTHSQWVPTMFVRMLKLPAEVRARHDVSSMACAIHAAAPCPTQVKADMIAWWGPVLMEYYAGTEGNGFTLVNSQDWLSHRGSVGKAIVGTVRILDDDGGEVPTGEPGTIYFADGPSFEYHNDPAKTAESRNERGWSTLGDVGYLDADGYLYLTDRKAFMIISGGVNIYPQEVENLLVTHPKVMDAAVFGVPNAEFGEEVKAVVQPLDSGGGGGGGGDRDLADELIAFCRAHLSRIKCPRSIDFTPELPRHPNGKLYKRLLKDRYWGKADSRIV